MYAKLLWTYIINKSTMQYITEAVHRPSIVQTNTVRGSAHPVHVKFMMCRAENTISGSATVRKYTSAPLYTGIL